jgi:hypothetical protein
MIRDYVDGDLDVIDLNDFSHFDVLVDKDSFKKILESWHSFTVYNSDGIECLFSYIEYCPDCYRALIVAGKRMSMATSKQIKRFLHRMAKELKAVRLETESLNCDLLNRWHKFLGFELEGTKRKYLNGRDYNMWSMIWA